MTAGTRIAVYGTLRKGQRAHGLLIQGAAFEKTATVGGQLVDLGGFPGYLLPENEQQEQQLAPWYSVVVEVYRLTEPTLLRQLDGYEGYYQGQPEDSLYLRKQVQIEGYPCWIYVFHNRGRPLKNPRIINSGDWIIFTKEKYSGQRS